MHQQRFIVVKSGLRFFGEQNRPLQMRPVRCLANGGQSAGDGPQLTVRLRETTSWQKVKITAFVFFSAYPLFEIAVNQNWKKLLIEMHTRILMVN
jgi:hypothetical protein